MSDDKYVLPWQMVFAILGLVGGIVTTWVTLKEEVVALKKDLTFLEKQLDSVRQDVAGGGATARTSIERLHSQLELIQADIQQMRIVRSRQ